MEITKLKLKPAATNQGIIFIYQNQEIKVNSTNLILNNGAEDGISNWTATAGVIESLGPGECAGGNPYSGSKYFGLGALCVDNAFGSAFQDQNISTFSAVVDSGLAIDR